MPGFYGVFFLKFLSQEKKSIKYIITIIDVIQLIPLGRVGGFSFPYFINGNLFTKSDLLNQIATIPEAKVYLPDTIKFQSLPCEFLINVSEY